MRQIILLCAILFSSLLIAQTSVNFTYDKQGRLKTEKYSDNFELYTNYDYEGNITGRWFVSLQDPLGADESQQLHLFRIFPNPVNNNLIVEIGEGDLQDINYRLYDNGGKLLLRGKSRQKLFELNFEDFTTGIYLLKIEMNNESETYKIVKE